MFPDDDPHSSKRGKIFDLILILFAVIVILFAILTAPRRRRISGNAPQPSPTAAVVSAKSR
jgi:hypothetical protein